MQARQGNRESAAEVHIPPIDGEASAAAARRLNSLAKVPGSLGRLEELAIRLAGMTGQSRPRFPRKAVALFASDHAIARHGLSSTGQEVTALQVRNFVAGGGTIDAFCRNAGAWLTVVDVGVQTDFPELAETSQEDAPIRFLRRKVMYGAGDFTAGTDAEPVWAMTASEALACLEIGMEVARMEAARGVSLLAAGEMGIGNTSPSSAIAAVLTGAPVEAVTGMGSGIPSAMLEHKTALLKRALARHFPGEKSSPDPVELLARVGGPEIGAMAGLMIGGASLRVPVVVDGFIAGAAAALAVSLRPEVRSYLVGSHISAEPGHRLLMDTAGVETYFDFGLRLGEGTGAALFFPVIDAAVRVLHEMATLEDLGITVQS